MKLDFIRGHMGGNLNIILYGDQLPAGRELELAVKALGPRYLWAHEAGILYPAGTGGAHLKARIVEAASHCFISACGGLTQVLGKALMETDLGRRFGLEAGEARAVLILETDAGLAEIEITVAPGGEARSVTNMNVFVRECYDRGIELLELQGIAVQRIGKFMVVDAEQIRRIHAGADFTRWDAETRRILAALQQAFMKVTGETEYSFALYDRQPTHRGDLRVVFPHCIPLDYFEPSCGTGSVAVGMAVLAAGEMERREVGPGGRVKLKLECGAGNAIGGPDITELFLETGGGKIETALFTHSFVEVTATGQVLISEDGL